MPRPALLTLWVVLLLAHGAAAKGAVCDGTGCDKCLEIKGGKPKCHTNAGKDHGIAACGITAHSFKHGVQTHFWCGTSGNGGKTPPPPPPPSNSCYNSKSKMSICRACPASYGCAGYCYHVKAGGGDYDAQPLMPRDARAHVLKRAPVRK